MDHALHRMTLLAACILTMGLGVIGCGGGGKPQFARGAVKGDINAQGKPLIDGRIMFVPTSGKGSPVTAVVKDGKFELPAAEGPAVGENRVEITAIKKTGKKVPAPDKPGEQMDEEEQYIPVQFNMQTTLIREIKEGDNTVNLSIEWSGTGGGRVRD